MKKVELTLAEWLDLYRKLCDAEQLLAQAPVADAATALLRDHVKELQDEVDSGWSALDAELRASKARAL